MTRVVFVDIDGARREVEAQDGRSLMEVAKAHGIAAIEGQCGGMLSCATCHVYVEGSPADALTPMSDDESSLLDGSSHRQANSRLSCQIRMSAALDGLRVTIAPED